MLSIDQCLKIDPEMAKFNNDEILAIRDACYRVGQLAFEVWKVGKDLVSSNPLGVQTENYA
jgi:hypothetical protein